MNMIASKMIRGRFQSAERLYGLKRNVIVSLADYSFEVDARGLGFTENPPKENDEVLIIDTFRPSPIMIVSKKNIKLYVNFDAYGLVHSGAYAVFLKGVGNTPEAITGWIERGYEGLNTLMGDWFTTTDDETDLTLLMIEHGGKLTLSNEEFPTESFVSGSRGWRT